MCAHMFVSVWVCMDGLFSSSLRINYVGYPIYEKKNLVYEEGLVAQLQKQYH